MVLMLKLRLYLIELAILLFLAIAAIREAIENWFWYYEVKEAENVLIDLGFSYQMSDDGSILVKSLFISIVIAFSIFRIVQYIFDNRNRQLNNLFSAIYFLLLLFCLLLPAFNRVIMTDRGIFYPFEYIAWQEVESYDRPVWLEDIFYIDRKKFRVSLNNKEQVEAILNKYLPDRLSKN